MSIALSNGWSPSSSSFGSSAWPAQKLSAASRFPTSRPGLHRCGPPCIAAFCSKARCCRAAGFLDVLFVLQIANTDTATLQQLQSELAKWEAAYKDVPGTNGPAKWRLHAEFMQGTYAGIAAGVVQRQEHAAASERRATTERLKEHERRLHQVRLASLAWLTPIPRISRPVSLVQDTGSLLATRSRKNGALALIRCLPGRRRVQRLPDWRSSSRLPAWKWRPSARRASELQTELLLWSDNWRKPKPHL